MESSRESFSDDSVEGEVESENDDVTIVDEEHETSQTTSTLCSAANDSSGNLSRKKRQPRSVVWKFFSALQGRKSVQCHLCPAGNRDGVLAYHRGTSSMREHLKRRHYTAFREATTNDSSDTSASKHPFKSHYRPRSWCYHQRFKANKFSRWGRISEPHELPFTIH